MIGVSSRLEWRRAIYNDGMKISLIDIGSNLTHESFTADRDAVMARALEAGVRRQVVTGADLPSSRQAAALAAAASGRAVEHRRRPPPSCADLRCRRSARNCASCCACRRSLRSANAASTIFAISRRPTRSARPSSRSWRSRPRSRKPVFLHQRDAHGDFAAILQGVSRRPGRRRRALLHRRRGGIGGLPGARSLHRRDRLGER